MTRCLDRETFNQPQRAGSTLRVVGPLCVLAMLGVIAVAAVLAPSAAWACTWCVSSAFGDRTFNWPYLGLIVAPFLVAGVIGGVLAWCSRRARREHQAPSLLNKETT
jgi:hypothetical protein